MVDEREFGKCGVAAGGSGIDRKDWGAAVGLRFL